MKLELSLIHILHIHYISKLDFDFLKLCKSNCRFTLRLSIILIEFCLRLNCCLLYTSFFPSLFNHLLLQFSIIVICISTLPAVRYLTIFPIKRYSTISLTTTVYRNSPKSCVLHRPFCKQLLFSDLHSRHF